MVAREILLRGKVVNGAKMRVYILLSIVLAISAFYELIEWWVALAAGQGADEFLGTQGYQWDTQSDMWYALIGAVAALVALSRWHDRQLRQLTLR
jgi:putative membrane protein